MNNLRPSWPERTGEALGSETTIAGLLGATCRAVVDVVDATASTVSRAIGDLLVGLAEYSRLGGPVQIGHGYLLDDYPLTRRVIETGEPQVVWLRAPDPDRQEAALLERLGFESLLMVALPGPKDCWGLVEVYANGRSFDCEDAERAAQVAAQAGALLATL